MRCSAYIVVLGILTVSMAAHAAKYTDAHDAALVGGELEDRYSPGLALTLSLVPTVGGTAAGIALMVSGSSSYGVGRLSLLGFGLTTMSLLLAPSFGHFYAGNASHGWGSYAARTGLALGGVGLLTVFALSIWSEETATMAAVSGAGALLCLGAIGGLAVWSIATAPRSAREANERQRISRRERVSLQLSPAVMKNARQENSYGLAFKGTF